MTGRGVAKAMAFAKAMGAAKRLLLLHHHAFVGKIR